MKFIKLTNLIKMYVLSMFNTGQVTLPKKWRSQFKTKKFFARSEGKKLIIEPVDQKESDVLEDENVHIYDGGKGIAFKKGLRGSDLDEFIEYLESHV